MIFTIFGSFYSFLDWQGMILCPKLGLGKSLTPDNFTTNLGSKDAWVKVFMISTEFRILRLTFQRKSASKMLNSAEYYRFSDLYSVSLKTIDHLSFNCEYLMGILQVLRSEF